jgi:hypothetical protein
VKIRLKKTGDGRPVVTAVRADGSTTSGRLGAGDFGAVHDLAHFAVETALGLRSGFYGLLAQGWAISDFAAKGAAARLPDEAIVAECLVGQITNGVFGGPAMSAADFFWHVRAAVAALRPNATVPELDEAGFRALRASLDALLARWHALPPGATLGLDFPD